MPDTNRRRDALDWITLVVSVVTLIAAGSAAAFTGWQAYIARDHEYRALRAYVVLRTPILKAGTDQETPYWVTFTAENMGATPVYNLDFVSLRITASGTSPGSEMAEERMNTFGRSDCANITPTSGRGTFSHEYSTRRGMSLRTSKDELQAFAGNQAVIMALGTGCYSDIFHHVHTIRFCYEWASVGGPINSCLPEGEQEYPD